MPKSKRNRLGEHCFSLVAGNRLIEICFPIVSLTATKKKTNLKSNLVEEVGFWGFFCLDRY